MWRQRDVDVLVTEQPRDVLCEYFPRPHLQLGMLSGQGIDQRWKRLVDGGERVREPERSLLASGGGLRSLPDAAGGGEGSPCLLHERLAGGRQVDAPGRAREELHAKRILDRLDLL